MAPTTPLKTSKSTERGLVGVPPTDTVWPLLQAAKGNAWKAAETITAKTKSITSDKAVQVTAASAAGSSVVLGASGAVAGSMVGGSVGLALGVVPAIFTFGLSIPVGAVVGGACGATTGVVAGGATGAVGGGAVGYGAYTKRTELNSLYRQAKTKTLAANTKVKRVITKHSTALTKRVELSKATLLKNVATARARATRLASAAQARTVASARAATVKSVQFVSERSVQVTAASAAGGAVVVGTGGAATGFVAGGAIGAALGVVPAIFTFGLSIPVCAAIGSAWGTAAGATAGGAAGLVGGGSVGYGAYAKRENIKAGCQATQGKISGYVGYVKAKATTAAGEVRMRLVGGTGGTAD